MANLRALDLVDESRVVAIKLIYREFLIELRIAVIRLIRHWGLHKFAVNDIYRFSIVRVQFVVMVG